MKKVEISLKEIVVYVLRRWKLIVAFACVLALLLGVYTYLIHDSSVSDTSSAKGTIAPTDVIADTTSIIDTIALKDKVVQSSIRSTSLSISIDLINYNPYEGIPKSTIYASLGARYLVVAQGAPLAVLWDGIAPEDLTDAELYSLVEVKSPTEGILTIVVAEAYGINSKTAAEALFDYLLEKTDEFSMAVNEHKLSILASREVASTSEPTTDRESAVKTFIAPYISSAIMGLLIGLVIGILTTALYFLVTLPVQIPEQIQRHLGVRYLGGVQRKKRLSLGDSFAGSLRLANEEQAMKIISANLSEFVGNHKRILVTGTISEVLIKEFTEKIAGEFKTDDVHFTYGADINMDASTITKLSDSDAVVLVERLEVSKLKQVNDEKERLDMSGKEVLGYVLL